jgi:drug/metabolite transporter (DMT)-like permease
MREAFARQTTLATALFTAVAMLAFAANSLLCRLALQRHQIDPASFSAVRLLSGALMLAVVQRLRAPPTAAASDWVAVAMLFAYVACFSFAYLALTAGTGALILFGAVQMTMFAAGLAAGERFAAAGWCGQALAAAGLVYMVLPGVARPSLGGTALMTVAGVAWGVYSLRGRGQPDPLGATAANFARAAPAGVMLGFLFAARAHASAGGVALAFVSGALTSGLGYVIWYTALRALSALRAAAVQVSVPILAALGGVMFLGEAFTARLAVASVAILGGIVLVLTSRASTRPAKSRT